MRRDQEPTGPPGAQVPLGMRRTSSSPALGRYLFGLVAVLLAVVLLAAAPLVASMLSLGGQNALPGAQTLPLIFAAVLLLFVAALVLGGASATPRSIGGLGKAQASLKHASSQAGAVRDAMLRQSAEAHRAAADQYARAGNERLWAAAINGLGIALRQLSENAAGLERVRLAAEATQCFRGAAEVYARLGERGNWATAQNNLGAALAGQASAAEGAERVRLLSEAVAAYQAALREGSASGNVTRWAQAMDNLGTAFARQAEMADGAEHIRLLWMAVEAHRAVAEARGPLSDQWRMTAQNNLGTALARLSKSAAREEKLQHLAAAVGAYRQVLGTAWRDRYPSDWARTQHNLAGALTHWAEAAGGTEQALLASEAVLACQEALQLRPRDTSPALWAATMNNLAFALRVQAEGTSDPHDRMPLLGASADACRQALLVVERGSQPVAWAELHNNLGSALLRQAELLSGPDRAHLAHEAAAQCGAALAVFTPAAAPQDHRRVLGELRRAEALLGER